MLFEDWVNWHWGTQDDDAQEWIEGIAKERERGLAKINEHFSTKPNYSIRISRETFISLPKSKDPKLGVWPDFTPIEHWLKENAKGEYYQYDPIQYLFTNDEDATAFKLRWG